MVLGRGRGREPREAGASRERQVTPDGKQSLSTTSRPRGVPRGQLGRQPTTLSRRGKGWRKPRSGPARQRAHARGPAQHSTVCKRASIPCLPGFPRALQCALIHQTERKLRLGKVGDLRPDTRASCPRPPPRPGEESGHGPLPPSLCPPQPLLPGRRLPMGPPPSRRGTSATVY